MPDGTLLSHITRSPGGSEVLGAVNYILQRLASLSVLDSLPHGCKMIVAVLVTVHNTPLSNGSSKKPVTLDLFRRAEKCFPESMILQVLRPGLHAMNHKQLRELRFMNHKE